MPTEASSITIQYPVSGIRSRILAQTHSSAIGLVSDLLLVNNAIITGNSFFRH
jgi:hypothetical protein